MEESRKEEGKKQNSSLTLVDYPALIKQIQQKVQDNKKLSLEDEQILKDVISNKEINQKHKILTFQILEEAPKIKNYHKLYPEIKKIADNLYDTLSFQAKRILQKNYQAIFKIPKHQVNRIRIVNKEVNEVQQINQVQENVLDLNFIRQVQVNQNKDIQNSKKTMQYLQDLPDQGDHKKWYRSSMGEVEYFLKIVRRRQQLTKRDLYYLQDQTYRQGNLHKIGRADPGIFEILKFCI